MGPLQTSQQIKAYSLKNTKKTKECDQINKADHFQDIDV